MPVVIAVILITRKPQGLSIDTDYKPLNHEDQLKSLHLMVYSKRFWQYVGLMVCAKFFSTFFSYSFKEYGENSSLHKSISDQTLTWAASIGTGLGQGTSRLLMGYLADKHTFRSLMTILTLISLAISLLVGFVNEMPLAYSCCVFFNYFQMGGVWSIYPSATIETFGFRQGPKVYAVIMYFEVVASLLNTLMTRYILPITSF